MLNTVRYISYRTAFVIYEIADFFSSSIYLCVCVCVCIFLSVSLFLGQRDSEEEEDEMFVLDPSALTVQDLQVRTYLPFFGIVLTQQYTTNRIS